MFSLQKTREICNRGNRGKILVDQGGKEGAHFLAVVRGRNGWTALRRIHGVGKEKKDLDVDSLDEALESLDF